MARGKVIDLTTPSPRSSPEPDETPNAAATNALQAFQPRKEKEYTVRPTSKDPKQSISNGVPSTAILNKISTSTRRSSKSRTSPPAPNSEFSKSAATLHHSSNGHNETLSNGSKLPEQSLRKTSVHLNGSPSSIRQTHSLRFQDEHPEDRLTSQNGRHANHRAAWPDPRNGRRHDAEPPLKRTRVEPATQQTTSYESPNLVNYQHPYQQERVSRPGTNYLLQQVGSENGVGSQDRGAENFNETATPSIERSSLSAKPNGDTSPAGHKPTPTTLPGTHMNNGHNQTPNTVDMHPPRQVIDDIAGIESETRTALTSQQPGDDQYASSSNVPPIPPSIYYKQSATPGSKFGLPYTQQDDLVLKELKEIHRLDWAQIKQCFEGRTEASLQVRYSTKLKHREFWEVREGLTQGNKRESDVLPPASAVASAAGAGAGAGAAPHPAEKIRRPRRDAQATHDGYVSWMDVRRAAKEARKQQKMEQVERSPAPEEILDKSSAKPLPKRASEQSTPDRIVKRRGPPPSGLEPDLSNKNIPTISAAVEFEPVRKRSVQPEEQDAISRILRRRELGYGGAGRGCYDPRPRIRGAKLQHSESGTLAASLRFNRDELKEHVFMEIGPRRYFKGTSGDVTALAWAPDGQRFAAGSIAISDPNSMQYNRPCNLLLGDNQQEVLKELPDHHVPRPVLEGGTSNPNTLHSMRETQDPRLFMTVTSVQFVPTGKGQILYSAGRDGKVRAYGASGDVQRAVYLHEIDFPAPVELMHVVGEGDDSLIAAATVWNRSPKSGIEAFDMHQSLDFNPRLPTDKEKLFPSALKWGSAPQHRHLLLSAFSEEEGSAGLTSLWDIRAQDQIELNATPHNVFDVTWNPAPSSASTDFAVALAGGANKATRSLIQCYATRQRAKRIVEWDCPAMDINDVLYCPYDDRIVAAGATDAKVYIWDLRFVAENGTRPLHVLEHGQALTVLDHDRPREETDTGVRFLSWGATASQLYSGSSDGVVKLWNPYLAAEDCHVKDFATFTSAVMSGAFSPDFRDLLIGEDQGRINSLGMGYERASVLRNTVLANRPKGSSVSSGKLIVKRSKSNRLSTGGHEHEDTINTPLQQFELVAAPAPETEQSSREIATELVRSGQISLKPAGALPKLQAVQGPNYAGPRMVPSPEDIDSAIRAEAETRDAEHQIIKKELASLGLASVRSSNTDKQKQAAQEAIKKLWMDNPDAREATTRHEASKIRSADLRRKAAEARESVKIAEANQRQLHTQLDLQQEWARAGHSQEPCKLDCNFLPVDNDGDVPDSRRSEGRIPGALRDTMLSSLSATMSTLTLQDWMDQGFTRKCTRCSNPAQTSKKSPWPLCPKCSTTSNGLTASCRKCSTPIRPQVNSKSRTSKSRRGVCERCDFACFRCAGSVEVSANASHITCFSCGIAWQAGVLGYYVVERKGGTIEAESEGELDDMREYHHSRWGE